jgi:hypothetical protein
MVGIFFLLFLLTKSAIQNTGRQKVFRMLRKEKDLDRWKFGASKHSVASCLGHCLQDMICLQHSSASSFNTLLSYLCSILQLPSASFHFLSWDYFWKDTSFLTRFLKRVFHKNWLTLRKIYGFCSFLARGFFPSFSSHFPPTFWTK